MEPAVTSGVPLTRVTQKPEVDAVVTIPVAAHQEEAYIGRALTAIFADMRDLDLPVALGLNAPLGASREAVHRAIAETTIVGWKVATSLHTGLALDALEMALRAREKHDGLVHHSDRGVQYLSIKYSDRLADVGVTASVGTKGDSYDNAFAESFNGLFKWELIYRREQWRDADHVEWETLLYVDWFNNRRLHGANGMVPPTELETAYYALNNNPAAMLISQ